MQLVHSNMIPRPGNSFSSRTKQKISVFDSVLVRILIQFGRLKNGYWFGLAMGYFDFSFFHKKIQPNHIKYNQES